MLAAGASVHDRQRTRRSWSGRLAILENPVGNGREGRVGSTGDGRFSGATYPPTETCGRSPLAAPVVFLTGRSRGRTRPGGRPGRRPGTTDVLEAGTAAGLADRTAGGRNRGRGCPGVAQAISSRPRRPAARTEKPAFSCTKSNRGGEIRTLDLLVPNQNPGVFSDRGPSGPADRFSLTNPAETTIFLR